MKKIISLLLLTSFLGVNVSYAEETLLNETPAETSITVHDDAPVWADYVAPKYRNPRHDFSRGGAIAEVAVGGVLTALILPAPIGVPMIVHGSTKIKMVSYNNRKQIFDKKIAEAQLIEDDAERQAAYRATLKKCNLKESTKKHYAKKAAKAEIKAQKKAAKKAKK